MIIAITGSHGTGKTVLCNALTEKLGRHWPVFSDYYRTIASRLDYKMPQDAIQEDPAIRQITSTAMAGSALGAMLEWLSVVKDHGIIDADPISLLAYHRYWLNACDTPVSPFMLRLARAICQQINLYCYLPPGMISLESDGIRSDDTIFQKDIDQWVLRNLVDLKIAKSKILTIESSELPQRTMECLDKIDELLDR